MKREDDLQAVLAGARVPRTAEREERVRLIGEVARALIAGEMPARGAALFVGGALGAWLAQGGDLERAYFRVKRRGSHRTPDRIWAEALIADERQQDVPDPTLGESPIDNG